jgi:hypothetical protein
MLHDAKEKGVGETERDAILDYDHDRRYSTVLYLHPCDEKVWAFFRWPE